MAAVGLALCSAVLFGSMSVALRYALRRRPDAEAGAVATAIVALVPCGGVALAGAEWHGRVWPFLLAGLLAPGSSQILYVLAVRDIGPSRAAVFVGPAPACVDEVRGRGGGDPPLLARATRDGRASRHWTSAPSLRARRPRLGS